MKRMTDDLAFTLATTTGGLAVLGWLFEGWIRAAVDVLALPLLWMFGAGT